MIFGILSIFSRKEMTNGSEQAIAEFKEETCALPLRLHRWLEGKEGHLHCNAVKLASEKVESGPIDQWIKRCRMEDN